MWKNKKITMIVTLLLLLFIFSNSLQDADTSGARSGRLLLLINGLLEGSGLVLSEFVLRKLAHFGEFMALGLSLFFTCGSRMDSHGGGTAAVAIVCGFFSACTDEFLQLFSEGRASRLLDVGIDTAGCSAGVLAACVLYIFMLKKGKNV